MPQSRREKISSLHRLAAAVGLCLIALLLASATSAKVVRFQLESREEIIGETINPTIGNYEKITGIIHLEIDPDNMANTRITDLHLAPRNARGRVAFSAEFELFRPVDLDRGNGRLIYFVNNRGNRHGAGFFSNQLEYNWLWDQGFSYLWCGWASDVAESDRRLNIKVPVATEGGQPVTGRVYAQMVNYHDNPIPSLPLTWGGSIPHAAISLDNTDAHLTRRRYPDDQPEVISNETWSFARVQNGEVIPDPRHLYMEGGIDPGWLYDLVYTSQNPPLTGLGLAAIRDVVSFFRYEKTDEEGRSNIMGAHVEHTLSWGHSQSGRLLNHFVWQGFNGDEMGRTVFDGVMPNCPGGGKGQFNSRFAQTTRHGSHLEDNLYPVDFFPFAYEKQTDPITGETGDALALARQQGNLPKMMIVNSATDYWTRAASLLHTDVKGERDSAIDPSVRVYSIAGIAHTEGRIGVVSRALLVALDQWISNGIEPPESRIPRIADGTLVDLAAVRNNFPTIPGFKLPNSYYQPYRLDSGPRWHSEGIADIIPPLAGSQYVSLVPQVDSDGNDIAGIRLPEIAVPLATFCGWYLRNPRFSNSLGRNTGRIWPLAPDELTGKEGGDERLSIAERYATPEDYVSQVKASLDRLRADRLILPMDYDRMLAFSTKQAEIIGILRPIDEIIIGESTEKAVAYFEKLREVGLEWFHSRNGSTGYAIFLEGDRLMNEDKYELAEKAFLLNTRLFPDDSDAWDSLANCLFKQELLHEAWTCYKKALEKDPKNDHASRMLEQIPEVDRGQSR